MSSARRRFVRVRTVRAFSLMEVLIAAFLLALGTLGLLALLAGAARQQQLTTLETRAAFAANNTFALASASVGELEPLSASNPAVADGVWQFAVAGSSAAGADAEDFAIGVTDDAGDLRNFLVNVPSDYVLYDRPQLFTQPVPQFNPVVPGPDNGLRAFPVGSIDTTSLELVVEFLEVNVVNGTPVGAPANTRPPVTRVFRRPTLPIPPDDDDSVFFGDENGIDVRALHLDGEDLSMAVPVQPAVYLLVDRTKSNPDINAVLDGPNNGSLDAWISSNFVSTGGVWVIDRIIARGYTYRSSRVASLGERVLANREGVPQLSYSAVYRTRVTGGGQLALLSYSITPADRLTPDVVTDFVTTEGGSIFRPRETAMNVNQDEAPLRIVDLDVGFDPVEQQYFVESTDAEAEWSLRVGQLLLMQGDDSSSPSYLGADNAVEIVRVAERASPGEPLRAYLDDAPRVNRRATVSTSQSASERTFLGIQGVITDAEDRVWRLNPVDFSLLQL
ncbi:MAG: hypothetical protein AAGD00_02470 [Planctomycetota bacterium]